MNFSVPCPAEVEPTDRASKWTDKKIVRIIVGRVPLFASEVQNILVALVYSISVLNRRLILSILFWLLACCSVGPWGQQLVDV